MNLTYQQRLKIAERLQITMPIFEEEIWQANSSEGSAGYSIEEKVPSRGPPK